MTVAALMCCALWGISTPIVKIGYQYVDASHPPVLILWVGIQFAIAGLLTIGICCIGEKKLVLPRKNGWKGIAIIAVFQTVLQYILLYVGLLYTTSVKGSILKSTDVFFVMLIASLLFKQEKLTTKKVVSCLIAFAGIILMNLDGLELKLNPLGDGLVVLSAICYSFGVVITKSVAQEEEPAVLCGYQMTLGGAIMVVIGLVFGGKFDLVSMLPIILGLSVLYAVSYAVWTVLLKHHPVSKVAIHSFMIPIFGVVFSAFMLQEDSGVAPLNLVAALILISAGIFLWGYQKKQVS